MEDIISNQQNRHRQGSIMAPLQLHHSSHAISKLKPKIRIVHLIAPEIIQTDVTNFRDLVQKLTGKPSGTNNNKRSKNSKKTKPKTEVLIQEQEVRNADESVDKVEDFVKCEDPWMNMEGSSSDRGYFSYLEEEDQGEVEGFLQSPFMGDLSSLFHVS